MAEALTVEVFLEDRLGEDFSKSVEYMEEMGPLSPEGCCRMLWDGMDGASLTC